MVLKSGRMNSFTTLKRMSLTQDTAGQQTRTWTKLGTQMAAIDPVRGREYFAASGEKADVTHEIRMRARTDIALTPRDRVYVGTRIFDVKSVLDLNDDGREWLLMCIENVHTTDG
jgi:SPP1 family predicted phage head-tail adaptor